MVVLLKDGHCYVKLLQHYMISPLLSMENFQSFIMHSLDTFIVLQ